MAPWEKLDEGRKKLPLLWHKFELSSQKFFLQVQICGLRLNRKIRVAPGSIEAASQQIKLPRIFEDLRESCLSLISSRNIYSY